MKKLVVIDDDYLVVQALETIVNSKENLSVVATGHSGQEAIDLYQEHQPDLLLMDIRMEPMSGIEAAAEILKRDSSAKILFITTFQDDDYITKAMSLGCRGYILKQNIKGIVPAVEAVENGHLVFDSQIIQSIHPSKAEVNLKELTERENQLLRLVADGLNNKEIADILFLSEGTVRNYVSALMEKLQLRDRTQLAVYYYKHRS
ncbi:DNA-binding response regulator [Streptococcus minor]|uniref:DNA-binding response regulator n=1 Tax=Streptococcus minor TaxID=229549 RepID=A0A3P1VE44_9STRE|nr:response regulator transcription factor [Streptococcus minor]RRD32489.1 DNA-binding response regulator [Streptococcus minor]